MSRLSAAAAVLLTLVATVAGIAPAAYADSTPARLLSVHRTSPDVLRDGLPLTLDWSAADADEPGAGVADIALEYVMRDDSGNVLADPVVAEHYLPLADGTSLIVRSFTPWAAQGHYVLNRISLTDKADNHTLYWRDGTVTAEPTGIQPPPPAPIDFAALDFDILNPLSDTAAPGISDLKPVLTSVRAGQPVVLTSTVADDRSGVADISVSYTSPGGTTPLTLSADPALAPAGLVSGLLPLGAEGGTWRAMNVEISDGAGNRVDYCRDCSSPLLRPGGVRPFQAQPPIDFASLDVDVVPLVADTDPPRLSGVSRTGPVTLHRSDDVVLNYTLTDASAITDIYFDYQDATGHAFTVMNQCHPERGQAVDQVTPGLDDGHVTLRDISVIDELFNVRHYRRDGSVWTQGHDQPDDLPGLDLSALDFDITSGAPTYTGHLHTRFGCPAVVQLPLSVPDVAAPGDVVPLVGSVLTGPDQPLPGAEVAVFQQPSGQAPQLLGIVSTDDAGRYSAQATLHGDTSYRVRFLGRTGAAGAPALTGDPHLVRAQTAAGPVAAPTVSLAVSPGVSSFAAPVLVTGHGTPGGSVELWAESRPATTYQRVRAAVVDEAGTWAFVVRPATSTRFFARVIVAGTSVSSTSVGLPVRSAVSLAVSVPSAAALRTLAGRALPARSGQLVSLYRRTAAGATLLGRVRTDALGRYSLTLRTPVGTASYDARAAATDRNAAGVSSVVRRLS